MRDILTSPRVQDIKRKRRAKRSRLAILLAILFVTIVGGLAYFSSNPHVTLNTVSVSGTRIINASDVQDSVNKDLSGKYIYLFARANTLIYPHDRIYSDLIRDFPRIETLSVSRVGFNTLHISITERAGAYLYCGASIPELEKDRGENCYFINNDGYVFDKAPYFSGNVYFKYYLPLPEGGRPLGSQIVSEDKFHKLANFIDKVTALGIRPTSIVASSSNLYLLSLEHAASATAPVVMFTDSNDLSAIADNLSVAMAKPEFAAEINSKYDRLLYIDLRFNNKVLYKFNE